MGCHRDDSEITANVNLFDQFTGAQLAVCGLSGDKNRRNLSLKYSHVVGRCLIHSGAQRHGACPIDEGARYNLILWMRSSWFREKRSHGGHGSGNCVCCKLHKEENPRDLVGWSKTDDRD